MLPPNNHYDRNSMADAAERYNPSSSQFSIYHCIYSPPNSKNLLLTATCVTDVLINFLLRQQALLIFACNHLTIE